MEVLSPLRFSALTILHTFSAYLLARLRANPLLSDLLAALQQAHDSLSAALQGSDLAPISWTRG